MSFVITFYVRMVFMQMEVKKQVNEYKKIKKELEDQEKHEEEMKNQLVAEAKRKQAAQKIAQFRDRVCWFIL